MSELLLKRVLVVDDESAYRLMVQQFLSRAGYTCESAADASEAMAILGRQPFDLVISDIRMRGRDGLELLKEALGSYPELAFIIMTGYSADYSYADIIAGGAADYLTKPFEAGELKAKVQRIERERRILNLLKATNESLARESRANAAVAQLSKALLSSAPVDQISRLALQEAQSFTASACGFVGCMDPSSGEHAMTAYTAEDSGECQFREVFEDPKKYQVLQGSVLAERRPLFNNAPKEDPGIPNVLAVQVAIHRFLAVPVIVGDALIGEIILANSERDYNQQDLELVERLAEIYGLAVQRKRAEESLEQARDYIENVFANSADAIGIIDKHGRAVKWNRMAAELFGYSFEALQEKKVFELYADKGEMDTMLIQLRRDGYVKNYEINMRRGDGSIAPFELSISLLRDEDGEVLGSVSVARDLRGLKQMVQEQRMLNEQLEQEIIERKVVEEELRQARHELQKLLEERTAKLSKAGELLKRSMKNLETLRDEK
jgi:PAS domain S-box-containing protein